MSIRHSFCLIIPLPVAVMPKSKWWNTCKPLLWALVSFQPLIRGKSTPAKCVAMMDSLEIGISLTLVSDTPAKIRGDGKFLKIDEIPALKVIAKSLGHKTFLLLCASTHGIKNSLRSYKALRSKPRYHSEWTRTVSFTDCTASLAAFSKLLDGSGVENPFVMHRTHSACNAQRHRFSPWVSAPGEGDGSTLQYSCLGKSLEGYSPWGCKSRTQPWLNNSSCCCCC